MDAKAEIQKLRDVAIAGKALRGLTHVIRSLTWASAYIGKGITEGVYSGTAVSAERALEIIEEIRDELSNR